MVTMRAPIGGMARLPVSVAWSEAGFARPEAEVWRQAGWSDAHVAAEWLAASPHDEPKHLRSMRDAGYTPDQLWHVGRAVRRHVAAWAAVTVAPAAGRAPIGHGRAAVASLILEGLAADLPEADVVIDLRDPVDEPATRRRELRAG